MAQGTQEKHVSYSEVMCFFSDNPIGELTTLPSLEDGKPQTFVPPQQHHPYSIPLGVHGETSATEGEPEFVRHCSPWTAWTWKPWKGRVHGQLTTVTSRPLTLCGTGIRGSGAAR